MSVSYRNLTMRRPVSPTPLPLVIRNPNNDNTKYDSGGAGPCCALVFGAGDYYWTYEGAQNGTTPLLICTLKATSATPHQPTVVNTVQLVAPNASPNWEQSEASISTLMWVPSASKFYGYYHGGNNAGPRQVGLLTAPPVSGKPGTWTRYSTSPIMPNGGTGWRQNGVADAKVVPPSAYHTDWRAVSRGWNASNASSIGLWTSLDGLTWTEYGSNPVIAGLGSGNENLIDTTGAMYEDELGRFHLWYCTDDGAGTLRTMYAFSDDFGQTWNRSATDVQGVGTGVATDPDNILPDCLGWLDDSGFLYHYCGNLNISGYPDGLGRLAGRGLYWHPKLAATQPARPGRAFVNYSANQRTSINSAASLMNSTVFTAWMEFRCPPGSQYRHMYTEYLAFNRTLYVRLTNTGVLDCMYRTATAIAQIIGTTRFDDGQLHRVLFVRTGASAFQAFVDGVSQGTATTSPGTDAGTFALWCGNDDPVDADIPLMGLLRQTVTIQGRALTTTEEATLYNSGKDGGTLPAGVTATVWIKHGSGGQAGPDAAQNGATYGQSVTAGTYLVNAAQTVINLGLVAVAQVTEADLAQAVTRRKTRTLGQVPEADLAQALTRRKTVHLLQVLEADLAQAVRTRGKVVILGQPTEADLAQAVAWKLRRLVGQVREVDLAQAVVRAGLQPEIINLVLPLLNSFALTAPLASQLALVARLENTATLVAAL